LWRPFSKHFGKQKQLFTGVMKDHYCWADGFTVDERFDNNDPTVTNPNLDTYNAPEKAQKLLDYINGLADAYRGNHVMIPFGCDFTFANAHLNF